MPSCEITPLNFMVLDRLKGEGERAGRLYVHLFAIVGALYVHQRADKKGPARPLISSYITAVHEELAAASEARVSQPSGAWQMSFPSHCQRPEEWLDPA